MDQITQLNGTVNRALNPLFGNQVFSTLLRVLLILYGGLAAPRLPSNIAAYLSTTYFRVFTIALIVFVVSKDILLAALIAVTYYVSVTDNRLSNAASSVTSGLSSSIANKTSGLTASIGNKTSGLTTSIANKAVSVATELVNTASEQLSTLESKINPETTSSETTSSETASSETTSSETAKLDAANPETKPANQEGGCPCTRRQATPGPQIDWDKLEGVVPRESRKFNAESVLASVSAGSIDTIPSGESAAAFGPTTTALTTETAEPKPIQTFDIAAWSDPQK